MLLHAHRYGDGPPFIILHGLLGSGENWRSLSRQFGARFSVVALDLRNHGHSPHTDEMSYETMAGDVEAFMDAEGIDEAFVMGHSLGGKVAMQLALTQSERVSKLIVVDMSPRGYRGAHIPIFDALDGLDLSTTTSRKIAGERLKAGLPDTGVRQFLLKNLALDPDTKRYTWRPNLAGLRAAYPDLIVELDPRLRYDGPVLFVRGTKSPYITDADWPRITDQFPEAELVSLDAGHWVHAEVPGAFADAVTNWLRT
ncbi:MAG: alpha/beta fold hydrolase [Bacteroidota bacterium]